MVDQECGTDRQIARLDPYRRLHMPIGTYAVPLECLADHRIFLSMPDQAYFFRIPVIDAEQSRSPCRTRFPCGRRNRSRWPLRARSSGVPGRNPVRPVHQPNPVGDLERQFEVVRGEENRLIHAPCQMMEQLHDLHLARKIKESSRFVQEDHGRFLGQCLGNHDLLPFPVRQGVDHAGGQVLDPYQGDRFFHDLLVLLAQPPPETGVGAAPHLDQFPHGHIPDVTFLRQDNPDRRAQLLVRIAVHITSQDGNLAFQFRLEGRQRTQRVSTSRLRSLLTGRSILHYKSGPVCGSPPTWCRSLSGNRWRGRLYESYLVSSFVQFVLTFAE